MVRWRYVPTTARLTATATHFLVCSTIPAIPIPRMLRTYLINMAQNSSSHLTCSQLIRLLICNPVNPKGGSDHLASQHGLTQDQEIERLKKLIELEKARKPGYWELFAEFYYSDENAPLYCRKYAKPKSVFKRPGTVCLDPTGKWKEIN